MPFGTLLALYKTFRKMPNLPPGSRDIFAEVSSFWGMSAKNDENEQVSTPIFPGIYIFPQNE